MKFGLFRKKNEEKKIEMPTNASDKSLVQDPIYKNLYEENIKLGMEIKKLEEENMLLKLKLRDVDVTSKGEKYHYNVVQGDVDAIQKIINDHENTGISRKEAVMQLRHDLNISYSKAQAIIDYGLVNFLFCAKKKNLLHNKFRNVI